VCFIVYFVVRAAFVRIKLMTTMMMVMMILGWLINPNRGWKTQGFQKTFLGFFVFLGF